MNTTIAPELCKKCGRIIPDEEMMKMIAADEDMGAGSDCGPHDYGLCECSCETCGGYGQTDPRDEASEVCPDCKGTGR